MVYYLEHAPTNKAQLKALDFDAHQLNFVLKMMRQCRPLRQGSVIVNLMDQSLPDGFAIQTTTAESHDGKAYDVHTIVKKGEQ